MALSNGTVFHKSLPANHLLNSIITWLQDEWLSECQDLARMLQLPHLRAMFDAADCIARQAYDLDNIENILRILAGENRAKLKLSKTVVYPKRQKLPKQKVVTVIKSEEPLGVTVRFEQKTGDILLARVLVGGAAFRSGLVNVGDQILEVNGICLRGRSPLEVINILQRECLKTVISFRIITCRKIHDVDLFKSYIVRAHFDYDPQKDDQIPCDKIGLAFCRGNILNVLNKDDQDWWQACKEIDTGNKSRMEVFQIAGLIPSKCLQERRIVAIREIKSQLDRYRYIHILGGLLPTPFRKAKWSVQKVKKIMYSLGDCIDYDREEIVTYEPVAKYFPEAHFFRPVILIGASGVGCSTLIQLMINWKPNRYQDPLLHTTRFRRFAEIDGIDYYFVREDWMEREINMGNFACYSKIKGNYYGIHKETIRQIVTSDQVCIFKMDAQFLRLVYTSEFKPYIIFVRPPYDVQKLVNSRLQYAPVGNRCRSRSRLNYEMHLMIYESHKLQFLYGHKFDSVLVNEDINQTFRSFYDILVSVENEPKWVPLTWVNKTNR